MVKQWYKAYIGTRLFIGLSADGIYCFHNVYNFRYYGVSEMGYIICLLSPIQLHTQNILLLSDLFTN